ncbi:MAG: hypothetical protein IKW74_06340, partial [Thermoguttaceae bacterium]|nr:hypothetical protein [Thermoguttaceae bacterium]
SQTRPEPVTIEHTWYGKLKARFAEHITLQPAEEPGGENDAPTYCYDEYTYTADYSDQLAAAICNNRDYYLRLAKNAALYAGLTADEIAQKMAEANDVNI